MDNLEILTKIGLLFLFLAIAFETVWISIRLRRAIKAGKQARAAANKAENESARILVIGDSTALGTGASEASSSIAGMLIRDFPRFSLVNESENSMSIKRTREKIETLLDQHFDIVMINTGGIDTLSFTPFRNFKAELEKILAYTKEMGASSTIIISMNNVGTAPIFHFPISAIFTYRSRQLSRLCESICREQGAVHVPLFTEFKDEPLIEKGRHHFAHDCIHPNDTGYSIWYERIKSVSIHKLQELHK
ncbi:hypothetical protein KC926_02085 [Candidatus Kaiserbacteria bacterium]|nr:hypothetical protein [Candidatus Kaiserbacteria bacterium]